MKKIFLLFGIFVLFSACRNQPDSFVSTESNSTSIQTAASTNLTQSSTTSVLSSSAKLTASTLTTTTTTPADIVYLESEPYSFSEVSPLFGPEPFSVNELSKIFGEPESIYGYYFERGGYFVLNVFFEDIFFTLAANNGEELNFIVKDESKPLISSDRYEVPDSARDVRMKPKSVRVHGEDLVLPRGMKFGDSLETLYNAYNENEGRGSHASEGRFLVYYDYGESGQVIYDFDSIIGKLQAVTINWHSARGWNTIPPPDGLPPL